MAKEKWAMISEKSKLTEMSYTNHDDGSIDVTYTYSNSLIPPTTVSYKTRRHLETDPYWRKEKLFWDLKNKVSDEVFEKITGEVNYMVATLLNPKMKKYMDEYRETGE